MDRFPGSAFFFCFLIFERGDSASRVCAQGLRLGEGFMGLVPEPFLKPY